MNRFTFFSYRMKIVQVHWPKVSSVDGLFVATNGALRLQGKYQLHRPGVYVITCLFVLVFVIIIFDIGSVDLSFIILKILGPYSPTILKNVIGLFLRTVLELEGFESNTASDWLNQTV